MTESTFAALRDGEELMTEQREILYRQVTIHTWDEVNRQPSSKAFQPTGADAGMSSYSREGKIDAKSAREYHTAHAKSASLGVWGLTVEEVETEGLRAVDDSQSSPPEGLEEWPPGHCFVDYRHLQPREIRTVRGMLLAKALGREEIPST